MNVMRTLPRLLSDTGQKKTPEKKDGRRMSFQRPKGTIEYSVESRDTLNSISLKFDTTPNKLVQLNKLFSRAVVPGQVLYVPDPEYVSSVGSSPSLSPVSPLSPSCSEADLEKVTDSDGPSRQDSVQPPVFPALRKSRVVSSTSEEEEALTEKFLKINCKYITDGKAHGCEEYGIMCPLEEVQSAAIYKEITDPKIRETVPDDLEPLPPERHPSQQKDPEHRLRDSGANDSGSTAPRSTEGSVSEDVFTESELSPIREEEQASNEDLRLDKSSGTSTESVLTITQVESAAKAPDGAGSSASQAEEPALTIPEDNPPDTATKNKSQSPLGSKQHSEERPPSTPTTTSSTSQGQDPSSSTSRPGSQSLATPDATASTLVAVSPKEEANEMSDVPKTDNMQQDKEEKENMEETPKQNSAEGTRLCREEAASLSQVSMSAGGEAHEEDLCLQLPVPPCSSTPSRARSTSTGSLCRRRGQTTFTSSSCSGALTCTVRASEGWNRNLALWLSRRMRCPSQPRTSPLLISMLRNGR
ncbi:hypothetical protein fugu_010414 [Takifugu bimaculatus]|uniref:Oxidation resistance protein 1 n=1 Tax=Takifugu bimaculatus TaxID=433685 RepID=A0A4Z2CFC3_9TELE|nr:hypothetical protein fugu_010414 [Takifugu bimaculatus]